MKEKQSPVVALLAADLHLSLRPPVARSAESDWMQTQAGYLDQLRKLATTLNPPKHKLGYKNAMWERDSLPIIIAGDYFDRHDPPPALINWALTHLPRSHGVPGQHDLPHHRLDGLDKTAYGVLAKVGSIIHLKPGEPLEITSRGTVLRLHGFPWGVPVTPCKDRSDLTLEVAVIHQYFWLNERDAYPGAPVEQNARTTKWRKRLAGYDLAVFGDNHKPFQRCKPGRPRVYNCGGFMRRKIDELDHRPSVGLLRADGSVGRHYLDVSKDQFITPEHAAGADFGDFLEQLRRLGDSALDFGEAVRRELGRPGVPAGVRRLLLGALEEGSGS